VNNPRRSICGLAIGLDPDTDLIRNRKIGSLAASTIIANDKNLQKQKGEQS